jgi:recombination protein RecA
MVAKAVAKPDAVTQTTDADAKKKAVELAVAQIEKQFGKGTIMPLSGDSIQHVEVIPTGALALDLALGVGGVPRGRVIEIYGPESSGKTTLCLHIIAEAQRRGGIAAFIDAEHAFDRSWAKRVGVQLDALLFSQPDDAEQALEIVETLVRSGAVDVIVVDSVAALAPRVEIAGEMGDSHVGVIARLMSQALRKLTAVINKSRTCVVFINQVREKIGVTYGNPETTPGGRALKFHASVRMEIRRGEALKVGTETVGYRTRVRVVKNKVAPPYTQAEFDMEFTGGISREGSILDIATDYDVIRKSGSFFSFGDTRLGQGRENAKAFLRENPTVAELIEKRVRELLSGTVVGAEPPSRVAEVEADDELEDFDDLVEDISDEV